MNKTIEKYQKIVDKLVQKSFPELRKKKIRIVEFPEFLQFWSFAQSGFNSFFILINKSQRKLNLKSIRGNLAHELCHITLDHKNKGLLKDLFHNIRKFLSFIFNTNFSRKIETKIDKEVIKRGYAGDLLSAHKSWIDFLSKENIISLHSRGYLTPNQIKSYAKSIGKWQ